ncbi:MAG: NAD(P)H-hydrate epimerase [Dehalococcoidia bacterium]
MHVKPDPSGFPQRKLAEVPAVLPGLMRDLQRIAQEEYGIDILQINENGGRAAARIALAMLGGRARGQRIVVLAGGGNKGATGLCAVRHLVNWGFTVEPVFAGLEEEMSFAARRQVEILRHAGIVEPADQANSEITVEEHLASADLVIDAVAGYGLEGPPAGAAAAAVDLACSSKRPILALDVPTGVSATSGQVYTPAIKACTTIALDLPKRGVIEAASREHVGELYLADLGIPATLYDRMGIHSHDIFTEGPVIRIRR